MDCIKSSNKNLTKNKLDQKSVNETVNGDEKPILNREHFHTEFDTSAYLKDFYTKVEDPAMLMVLNFLPSVAARLPEIDSLLDFGAGPTIHTSVCFRNKTKKIYLADYLPQNRAELQLWLENRSSFDWTNTLRKIASAEGIGWNNLNLMESFTRTKIFGIFHCNCLQDYILEAPKELLGTFDMLTTIFTLEYCCNTLEEYKAAIRRLSNLIRPGGYFLITSVCEETWCAFGGRKFSCLYVTKDCLIECLRESNINVDPNDRNSTIMYEINGMIMLVAKKMNGIELP